MFRALPPVTVTLALAAALLPASALAQLDGPFDRPIDGPFDGPFDGPDTDVSSGFGISSNASTRIGFRGDLIEDAFDGGEFAVSTAVTENTHGTARASGVYQSSADFLPELRAFATSTRPAFSSSLGAARANAGAVGIQAYLYEGTGPRTFDISYQLDAVLTGNGSFGATAAADFAIWSNTNPGFITDPGTLFFESSLTGNPTLQRDSLFADAAGNNTLTNTLSITLDPGDSLFVFARLNATAGFGAIANAENTFTASFADATGLTASAVPEPASAALVAIGGFALLGRRRQAA